MPHATPSPPEIMEAEDSVMPNAPAQAIDAGNTTPPTEDAAMADAGAKSATNLEEIFDDDDDDDEFSSSAVTDPTQSSQPTSQKAAFSDSNILSQFYQRLLPFRPLFQWLNHSATPQPDFQHREFAFTLSGDRYVRYQSFASAELLRKACVQLVPERFEIGPQYNINPRDRKTVVKAGNFKPIMKELVFDIDMTDYDPIRTCCSGAAICHKCWTPRYARTLASSTSCGSTREDVVLTLGSVINELVRWMMQRDGLSQDIWLLSQAPKMAKKWASVDHYTLIWNEA
jgi:DNA primase small subunit